MCRARVCQLGEESVPSVLLAWDERDPAAVGHVLEFLQLQLKARVSMYLYRQFYKEFGLRRHQSRLNPHNEKNIWQGQFEKESQILLAPKRRNNLKKEKGLKGPS